MVSVAMVGAGNGLLRRWTRHAPCSQVPLSGVIVTGYFPAAHPDEEAREVETAGRVSPGRTRVFPRVADKTG